MGGGFWLGVSGKKKKGGRLFINLSRFPPITLIHFFFGGVFWNR